MAESVDRFAPAQASGTTGGVCTVTGPYRSTRNSRVVVFVLARSKFPADTDGASTTWSLVSDAVQTRGATE